MTPGKTWENDGLPIGNGYFGALVLGGISEDRIRLTDPSLRDEGGARAALGRPGYRHGTRTGERTNVPEAA